jgi:hypothetical protein
VQNQDLERIYSMKKFLRLIFVVVFMAVFVALGTNGTTWAGKLDTGNQQPASSVLNNDLSKKERPHGTVDKGPDCEETSREGEHHTVASIATWQLKGKTDGKKHKACEGHETDLPRRSHHGHLLTAPVILTVDSGNTLNVDQLVCFPVPPTKVGSAYYWDNNNWVKTEDAKNGQACVTVPANAPGPAYTALFDN